MADELIALSCQLSIAAQAPALRQPLERPAPGRPVFGVLTDKLFDLAGDERADGGAPRRGDDLGLSNRFGRQLESQVLRIHTVIIARDYVQHV